MIAAGGCHVSVTFIRHKTGRQAPVPPRAAHLPRDRDRRFVFRFIGFAGRYFDRCGDARHLGRARKRSSPPCRPLAGIFLSPMGRPLAGIFFICSDDRGVRGVSRNSDGCPFASAGRSGSGSSAPHCCRVRAPSRSTCSCRCAPPSAARPRGTRTGPSCARRSRGRS